jgi:hypothetical protein
MSSLEEEATEDLGALRLVRASSVVLTQATTSLVHHTFITTHEIAHRANAMTYGYSPCWIRFAPKSYIARYIRLDTMTFYLMREPYAYARPLTAI